LLGRPAWHSLFRGNLWGSLDQTLSQPRLAVLIDAENVSHNFAPTIFREIARFGVPRVQRIYGSFTGSAGGWEEATARFALEARPCIAPAARKNGADIMLTIDAMDLLHGGGIDGFCIVSSDGDFADLAGRIRREGRLAYGFGNGGKRFRLACSDYVVLALPGKATRKAATAQPHAALPAIRAALEKTKPQAGWYCLAAFGSLARQAGVDPKSYGVAKLSSLLRATGQYELESGKQPNRFRPIILRAVSGL
jgi:NYN domain/OST-HTH/LOTUS domain